MTRIRTDYLGTQVDQGSSAPIQIALKSGSDMTMDLEIVRPQTSTPGPSTGSGTGVGAGTDPTTPFDPFLDGTGAGAAGCSAVAGPGAGAGNGITFLLPFLFVVFRRRC